MSDENVNVNTTATPQNNQQQNTTRDVGPIQVLTPEDVAHLSISERQARLTENRNEIFVHNVRVLREKHGISQAAFCESPEYLDGFISSAALSTYKNVGRYIPFQNMVMIAAAFHLPVERMTGELLDKYVSVATSASPSIAKEAAELEKYVGTFTLSYFDTSKMPGKNDRPTEQAMAEGILTICAEDTGGSVKYYRVFALLNCNRGEKETITNLLRNLDLRKDGAAVKVAYESVVSDNPLNASIKNPRTKLLYTGDISISDTTTAIDLQQIYGTDVAHMLMLNRTAGSSDRKPFRGGLATAMSSSRGQEHDPCVQAVIFSKDGYGHASAEELAKYLYFDVPQFHVETEIREIINYMKMLYARDGMSSPMDSLSETDKAFLMESYVAQKLSLAARRNLLSYYNISREMDSEVYDRFIKD